MDWGFLDRAQGRDRGRGQEGFHSLARHALVTSRQREKLRMQLDIFENSRDVMLRNDVIHALEQLDAVVARDACDRLAQEYPADESLTALRARVDELGGTARNPFVCHLALRQARQAIEELQPTAQRVLGLEGGMKWLAPLWEDLAPCAPKSSSGSPFEMIAPEVRLECQRQGDEGMRRTGAKPMTAWSVVFVATVWLAVAFAMWRWWMGR